MWLRQTRTTLSCRSVIRSASNLTIDRLQLDINSHHNQDQLIKDPVDPVEKSPAAVRGESYRGDVTLPDEFQAAVEKAIEDGEDKPGLRLKALELYAHLRTTGAISTIPTSYRDRQALLTTYDPPTSLAYLAGLMPSIYGATVAVLTATSDRLKLMGNDWVPDRVIDFGSGTGSAAWATQEVWGPVKQNGEPRQYIGLDASRAMVELSSTMLGALPAAAPIFPPAETRLRLKAATYNLPIPAEMSAMAKMQLGPTSSLPGTGFKTIALAAFTLGDLGTREKRKDVVREIWDSGAEVIVLIDRGTPQGSRIILEAREQLIMLGQRSLAREKIDGVIEAQKGCFVLSPCPHDGVCPLHNSARSYCHFSQRVRSPPFLRHTKHTTRGEDDAKYSYVVIQRGVRPLSASALSSLNAALALEAEKVVLASEPVEIKGDTQVGDELEWPRLVAPPLKRSGHVILEVCAVSGEIERHTVPKSQGRQIYYDARKARWGDTFPHEPKVKMLAPQGKEMEEVADKFGKGRTKLRSKKADRTGRGDKVDLREDNGRGRRKSKDPRDIGSSQSSGGDAGGVKDYELEIGPDGSLKIIN